jgi:hypothetical protein
MLVLMSPVLIRNLGGWIMKAKDWVVMFQGFDPDEEVIALVYTRDLFGDVLVSPTTGEELGFCPQDSWNLMAQNYEPRDYAAEAIYDDIMHDVQGVMDAFALKSDDSVA